MNERIFISYKRVDKERVFKLRDLIEYETKEKCWMDLDGIESDAQFANVIIRSINNADLVLFMYSYAHTKITDFENDWTIRELNFAQEKNKRIVFINIDNTPLNDWFKLMFPRKQQVDVSSEVAVKKLIQDLKKWLNESSSSTIANSPNLEDNLERVTESSDDDFETAEVLFDAKEYNDALLYYLESARKGNKTSKNKLCQFFYDSRQLVENISDEVWERVEQLSEKGEYYADFILHCKYFFDPLNNRIAFDYAKKATHDKNIPLAFLRLGMHYGWGVGTKQNHILAMHNYMKAFSLGCKEACGYIGSEYEWGSSKTIKDLDKAIDFYKKGVDLLDKRSMAALANIYYYKLNKVNDAKEVAQKMIQCGYYRGYVLMGDFCALNADYTYNYDKIEEAKKWYKKALCHDEFGAYASLAGIYWDIDDNKKEAYSLVYQGYQKHDSSSISTLACFCRIDGELEKAWLYYKECFDRYGSNVINIGSLFFDYHYRKDKKEDEEMLESDLENILSLGAHNGELEALKFLIRLHSLQESGEDRYEYDIFKQHAKIQEDIKLGAELNFPEMMFFYGRLLLEDSCKVFNPAKGVNYIIRSVEEGYNDALPFLLEYKKTGTYKDDVDYDKIATIAIKQKFIEDNYIEDLLRFGENNEELSEEFKEYLRAILDNNKEKMKLFVLALNVLLNKHKKGDISIKQEELDQYRSNIEIERSRGNLGYISALKSHLDILYPEYNEEKVFLNYTSTNEIDHQLFYAANYANDKEIDVELQDDFLGRMYSLISFDESLAQDDINYDSDVKDLIKALKEYRDVYLTVCKNKSVSLQNCYLPKREFLFPYMPSSVCVKISHDTFNVFMSLQEVYPEIYAPIFPILQDMEKVLDYVEKMTDQDLQLFFIGFVEIKIEVEAILQNNYRLYKNYKDYNKKAIAVCLNRILEKYGDKAKSKESNYTEANLPDLSEILPKRTIELNEIYDYDEKEDSLAVSSTQDKQGEDNEDSEFERLLDEFINSKSQSEEDDVEELFTEDIPSNLSIVDAYKKGSDLYYAGKYKEALGYLIFAAEQGHADAQYFSGLICYLAYCGIMDFKKAAYWFEKAALQDHVFAEEHLGRLYLEGKGVKKDYEKAIYWYKAAANHDNPDAYFAIAEMYEKGKGVMQSDEIAFENFLKAASIGSSGYSCTGEAMKKVASMYEYGVGVSQNKELAIKMLKKYLMFDDNRLSTHERKEIKEKIKELQEN